MEGNVDSVHACMDDNMKRAKAIDRKCVVSLVSEKSLKCQLQLQSDDSQQVEVFKYRLHGAFPKERRAETITKSL